MIEALYPLALLGLFLLLLAMGESRDARTGGLLLVNWAACMVAFTGGQAPWAALIVIDGLTAWAILRPPAGVVQAVVAALLLNQILWHCAYGWVGHPAAQHFWLTGLNLAGWLQVATLLGGATHDAGRKIRSHPWRPADRGPPSSGRA